MEVTFPAEADEGTYAAVHRVIAAVVELEGTVGWLSVPPPLEGVPVTLRG